jgi:hypothetical protein
VPSITVMKTAITYTTISCDRYCIELIDHPAGARSASASLRTYFTDHATVGVGRGGAMLLRL